MGTGEKKLLGEDWAARELRRHRAQEGGWPGGRRHAPPAWRLGAGEEQHLYTLPSTKPQAAQGEP